MIANQDALLKLWPIFITGILLFDLILYFFNDKMTISRAVVRSKPGIRIILCAALCYLIAHLFGGIVP